MRKEDLTTIVSSKDANLVIILFWIVIIIVIITVLFVIIFYIKKNKALKNMELNIYDTYAKIPVIAWFGWIKGTNNLIGISKNNFNPKLIFWEDYIEYKIFFTKKKKYTDIESVDIYRWFKTENIVFIFKDSSSTFSANVLYPKNLIAILKFLQNKNCPLSENAKELLGKEESIIWSSSMK